MTERIFQIGTDPNDTGYRMYKRKNATIESGVTVLVGCNGSGKTTLLNEIMYQLKDLKIPFVHFDNLENGGSSLISESIYNNNIGMAATAWTASEGERIILGVGNLAGQLRQFVNSGGEKDGKRDSRMARIFAKDNEPPFENSTKELWILIDATDSGLSVDNVRDVKGLLHLVEKDAVSKGYAPYILISANEYEMCKGEECFSVQDSRYISFSSYEKYADFVMATRAYKDRSVSRLSEKKDKCIDRLSEKKERDEGEYDERG